MVFVGKHLDVLVEDGQQLFSGDAAECRVLWHHGDIAEVVQGGEDAQLTELGDARDEDELLVGIAHLHHLVELLHDASHLLQLVWLVQVIQQGRVVFIEDDDGLQAGVFVQALHEFLEPRARRAFRFLPLVFPFVIVQLAVQFLYNLADLVFVLARTHVEMQDRILFPVFFQFGDGQALEQVLASLEVILQGAAKQALAEPSRTAEEDELRFSRQFIDKVSLVNVDASVLTDAFKIGDAGGVESHGQHGVSFLFAPQS